MNLPDTGAPRARHLPTLDGWRALAILLVIGHHGGTNWFHQAETQYYASNPLRFGTVGVSVFFGLSGVLITKLLLEEFDRTGAISLKSFYTRRAFRILPPAFAFILAVAALGLMVSRTEALSTLLFFRNYLPDSLGGLYTGHFWSLAVEEHFYLLWPGLLVLVGVRRGLAVAASISLALVLWGSVDYHWHLYAKILPGLDTVSRTDLRLDFLFFGCTMAFLLHRPDTREWLRRYYSLGAWILVMGAFLYMLFFPVHLSMLWMPLSIPLAMVGTVLHPQWRVSRMLDLAPVRWIGRISYSLYLWQQIFLVPYWHSKPMGALQEWPLNIVLVLMCACASYYLIEKPINRLGHQIAGRIGRRRPAQELQTVVVG
jgi:peptidoglycan/LPS O-acetylase OafA/YrhL